MDLKEINEAFIKAGKTLGCAESFTGGLFASEITKTPGASHFFKGGFVTYSNEEKAKILGIKYETIDRYGVVSQEVAGEMSYHARALLGVDYCVSFTGNAGPEAMEGKPVGEIYIGVATYQNASVYKFNLQGDRDSIREQAIMLAKDLLLNLLAKNY